MDIKTAIAVLCKLLNRIYLTNLKPEHFRLAKFNKNEENVVSDFLKLKNCNLSGRVILGRKFVERFG